MSFSATPTLSKRGLDSLELPSQGEATAGFRPIYFVDSIGGLMRSSGPNQCHFTHPSGRRQHPQDGQRRRERNALQNLDRRAGEGPFVEVNRISTVTRSEEHTS